MKKNHYFHFVTPSPWPIMSSMNLLTLCTSLILMMHFKKWNLLIMSTIMLVLSTTLWYRDIIRESTFQGNHTMIMMKNLKTGMLILILSEIMFFMSFFWSFLNMSLSPNIELGMSWPPKNLIMLDPLNIPLLNTMILISSGISVTWTHQSLMENNLKQSMLSLMMTIILGVMFTILQISEYKSSSFSMPDSVWGSTFFMTTGFHGIHVLVGTMFLMVNLTRLTNCSMSAYHHIGLEMAIWYWHFVDIIWLFLYMIMYW